MGRKRLNRASIDIRRGLPHVGLDAGCLVFPYLVRGKVEHAQLRVRLDENLAVHHVAHDGGRQVETQEGLGRYGYPVLQAFVFDMDELMGNGSPEQDRLFRFVPR